jgi:DNA-binding PadR family transcriptional regulator
MGLVRQQPQSGYDIMKTFETTAISSYSSSPGAVYPALRRLEEAGLIAGEVENRDSLRPRQVYHVTPAGERELRQYLLQPITREDIAKNTSDVMLRFVFTGNVLGRREAVRMLTQYAQAVDAYIPELKRQLAIVRQEALPYAGHALEHGIEQYRAEARWARRVIARLQDEEDDP